MKQKLRKFSRYVIAPLAIIYSLAACGGSSKHNNTTQNPPVENPPIEQPANLPSLETLVCYYNDGAGNLDVSYMPDNVYSIDLRLQKDKGVLDAQNEFDAAEKISTPDVSNGTTQTVSIDAVTGHVYAAGAVAYDQTGINSGIISSEECNVPLQSWDTQNAAFQTRGYQNAKRFVNENLDEIANCLSYGKTRVDNDGDGTSDGYISSTPSVIKAGLQTYSDGNLENGELREILFATGNDSNPNSNSTTLINVMNGRNIATDFVPYDCSRQLLKKADIQYGGVDRVRAQPD